MKLSTAIIQSHVLKHVIKGFHLNKHYPAITITGCDARGRGSDGYYIDSFFLKSRKRIDTCCSHEVCEELAESIRAVSRIGKSRYGAIGVSEYGHTFRINTGQKQGQALQGKIHV